MGIELQLYNSKCITEGSKAHRCQWLEKPEQDMEWTIMDHHEPTFHAKNLMPPGLPALGFATSPTPAAASAESKAFWAEAASR